MKLICYLSNGYPSIADSIKMAQTYVEAGCDIIEIDFPSHNPYLESEYLSARMKVALASEPDYQKYMDGMAEVKRLLPNTTFILMVYESTLQEIGYEKFVDFCKAHDFMDLILVGIQDDAVKNRLMADGVRVSCYVQYALHEKEVASAKASNGFVYMQGKPLDSPVHPDYPELSDCIGYLRGQGIDRPIYCGVGIHTPEDAKMAKQAGADAVFVGSTILKLHDDRAALMAKIREFKAEC